MTACTSTTVRFVASQERHHVLTTSSPSILFLHLFLQLVKLNARLNFDDPSGCGYNMRTGTLMQLGKLSSLFTWVPTGTPPEQSFFGMMPVPRHLTGRRISVIITIMSGALLLRAMQVPHSFAGALESRQPLCAAGRTRQLTLCPANGKLRPQPITKPAHSNATSWWSGAVLACDNFTAQLHHSDGE